MEIKDMVDEIFDELVEIRRDFHMYPELSQEEFRTSEQICKYLDSWGIEYDKNVADTGVVAIIRGPEGGKTVGARADIDALPIVEINDLAYKSKNPGVMHACGHDIHTTIHLGVAKILKSMEKDLRGSVKIFFQPAEETIGGADRMIQEGYMENPKVDSILSLHVLPSIDAGHIQLKYGKMNAATNEFTIRVKGLSGHAAYPESSIDPIVIAAQIVIGLQTIVSRNTSPVDSVVISLGQIHGGTKNNVIPGEVILSGTLRTLDEATRVFSKKRIEEVVENTAIAHGGTAWVEYEEGYPALINDDGVTEVLKGVAEELLGPDKVSVKDLPSMGADDFSYFLNEARGVYYYLGSGNQAKGNTAPIHNDKFMVDEQCIKTGVLLQVVTMLKLMEG